MTTTITVIGPSYIATRCDTSSGMLHRRHFADLHDALEFSLTYRSVPAGTVTEYVALEGFNDSDLVDKVSGDSTQTAAEDYRDECQEARSDFRSDR